jgi:SAM-dependent methyltransferase
MPNESGEELYDVINGWDESDDFYLDLVLSADAVLDVGCGTGMLLKGARRAGHTGRLCGLDPAPGMLAQATERPDIEWVRGEIGDAGFREEFDLVVMTGHAFQVFLTDEEVGDAFAAVRRALRPDGRFAFETRNPAARAWERWTPENGMDVTGPDGVRVRVEHRVTAVEGDVVRMTETFSSPGWPEPRVDEGALRFMSAEAIDVLLREAGLEVARRYGFWDRSEFTAASREIITVARRGR